MNTNLRDSIRALRSELDKVVSGYDDIKDMIIVCLLADGHVLLQAVPGTAKTTLVNTLQAAIEGAVAERLQMTPDLKPTDILGVEIFDQSIQAFKKRLGVMIRANLLLADEINRTTPKTLSALLQAMQERKVTIGDETFDLLEVFMVLATMNPVEQEGTYPIPEATLDRFAMMLLMQYVSRENEINMLSNVAVHGRKASKGVKKVVTIDQIIQMRAEVLQIAATARRPILEFIVDLARATRPGEDESEVAAFDAVHGKNAGQLRELVQFGVSPRCEIWTLHTAAAVAYINGDDHIEPDHVKKVFRNVARHRVILTPLAEAEKYTADKLIDDVLSRVKVTDGRTGK